MIIPNELIEHFTEKYCIPRNTVENHIREIIYNNPKSMRSKFYFFRMFFKFYLIVFYFIIQVFFGKKNDKKINADIVFEVWKSHRESFYNKFYKRIHKILKKNNVNKNTFLFTIDNVDATKLKADSSLEIFESKSLLMNSKICLEILLKEYRMFFFLLRLHSKYKIDIFDTYFKFIRHISLFSTYVMDFNSKILISAWDTEYPPLKYAIYKMNGIENIFLIQNGLRAKEKKITYCDYYFGFGEQQLEIQNVFCEYKYSIGSIPLHNRFIGSKNLEIKYDICVIEEIGNILGRGPKRERELYNIFVDNIIKFSQNYPSTKICYITRKDKRMRDSLNKEYLELLNEFDGRLKKTNIYIDKIDDDSYINMLISNIVIFSESTLGVEALGADKRILRCNYSQQGEFASHIDEIGTVIDSSYDIFENKLLYLLNHDNQEISEYYRNKKNEYMNLNEDPSEFIVKKILNN